MRRWAVLANGMLLSCLNGCILVDTYEYDGYKSGTTDGTSSSGGSSSISSGNVGGGSSSAGGAGGTAASGGMGGMGGTSGQGGMGGGDMCPPDVCDDDVKVCGKDCKVSGIGTMRFGTAEHQAIKAMTTNTDGAIVIGGDYAGSLAFGTNATLTNTDSMKHYPFVAKLDANGEGIYADEYTTPGVTRGVAIDSTGSMYGTGTLDNVPIAGQKQIFVRRFGTGGWQREFGSSSKNSAVGIAYDGSDHMFVAGVFGDTLTPPNCTELSTVVAQGEYGDSLLMQFVNNGGACSRARVIPNVFLRSIAATPGLVVVGGIYSGSANTTLNLPPVAGTGLASFFAIYDVDLINVVRKNTMLPILGGTIVLVNVAFDPTDNQSVYITAKLQGSYDTGKKVLTSTGGVDPDLLVAKFDPDGILMWAQRFGGPGAQVPFSITPFKDGIFISGTTTANMAINPDSDSGTLCSSSKCMFLLKLSPETGLPIWGRAFGGGEGADDPTAVSTANNSAFWLGGGWSSSISFGDEVVTPTGGQDLVLTRFTTFPP